MSSRSALALVVLIVLVLAVGWFTLRRPHADSPDSPETTIRASGPAEPSRARPAGEDDDGPMSVPIVGRVVAGGSGVGIEGALVVLQRHAGEGEWDGGSDRHVFVRSDAGGGFRFDAVAPGQYAISATAPRQLPAVGRTLEIGSAAPNPITLTLETGGRELHGTVEDITGGPIEEAMIRALPVDGFAELRAQEAFATLTKDDGTYALQLASGRYRLEVSHADYASVTHAIDAGGGDMQQDFQLVPTAAIEGVVLDAATRAPIPRATVSWSSGVGGIAPGSEQSTLGGRAAFATADAHGRFAIRGLRPGLVRLSARAEHRASASPLEIPVAIAEHIEGVELALVPAFDVAGRVVSSRDPGAGVAAASVLAATNAEGLAPSATADAHGRFVVHGVLPGHYTLITSAPGHLVMFPPVELDIEADIDDVELRLDPGLRISGRVSPAALAQVSFELVPENLQMGAGLVVLGGGASAQTDEDGTFELGPVGPGRLRLVARASDGRAGEVDVDVGSEGAQDVVVELEPRITVSGTLTGSDGTPIAQALVSLHPQQAQGRRLRVTINGRDLSVYSGVTADDGSFSISGLRAGDYEVTAADRYGDSLEVKRCRAERDVAGPLLAVPERNLDNVELVVDQHTEEIGGIVRTPGGDPAEDVWVTLARRADEPKPDGEEANHEMRLVVSGNGVPGSSERPPVLTGEDGTFRFGNLREGEYTLVAEAGGGTSRATKTVRSGDHVTLELAPLDDVEMAR